jgi:photosystem I P700 chlorophyll a apoprotein A2
MSGRCATNKYFQMAGSIHDIESYFALDHTSSLNISIFLCHWCHLAIILFWVSRIQFHIGSHGNYQLWCSNPINSIPIAHAIFDPHFALSKITNKISDNGIYNNLLSLGFNSVFDLYKIVITSELLALISIGLASLHFIYLDAMISLKWTPSLSISWPYKLLLTYFDLGSLRLNFHTGIIIGVVSSLWSGHLVHLAIPAATGMHWNSHWNESYTGNTFHWNTSQMLYTGNWVYDIAPMDKDSNIFTCPTHAGSSLITFFGGLKSNTISLYLTDIAHHHLGVGILFVLSSHLYCLLYKATILVQLLGSHRNIHLSLSLGCTLIHSDYLLIAVITSVLASQISLVTPYVYLCYDYITRLALYVIGSTLMMASMTHAAIWIITDELTPLGYKMKGHLVSHLSWICLYVGFHTLGVYIHNDTILAFGQLFMQIVIEPVFGIHLSTRLTALHALYVFITLFQ